MNNSNKKIFFALMAVLLCLSCNKSEKRIEIAKHKMNQYYAWLSAGNIDSIFSLFPKRLFSEKDSIRAVEQLEYFHKLGPVVSNQLYNVTDQYRTHEGKVVLTITLKYHVYYSDSSKSNEQFQFMTVEEDQYFDKLVNINLNAVDN